LKLNFFARAGKMKNITNLIPRKHSLIFENNNLPLLCGCTDAENQKK
jgi:hypothetical protein